VETEGLERTRLGRGAGGGWRARGVAGGDGSMGSRCLSPGIRPSPWPVPAPPPRCGAAGAGDLRLGPLAPVG